MDLRRLLSSRTAPALGCLLLLLSLPVAAAATDKPSIILITIDSARADRMGFLGSGKHLTPNLDKLADQALVFERAYAQAPTCVVSHATILSGTYPQFHRASELGFPLQAGLPYAPDLLRAAGYRTAAFVGSLLLDPIHGSAPGFERGFAVFDAGFQRPKPGATRYQTVERRGADVVARALAWLGRQGKGPFFLWVQLHDPHAPYTPPPSHRPRRSLAPYEGELAYADASVGKLLAALKAKHRYEEALIVVTSDHGESLGAHGEETHGLLLYEETVHVPLLLKLPRGRKGGLRVPARVRLVDVAPTLLEAAGIPAARQMQGQSLVRIAERAPAADQPAYAVGDFSRQAFGWSALQSWRTDKYLFVRAPQVELYDLSVDRNAVRNLASSSRAVAETLAAQVQDFDRRVMGGAPAQPEFSGGELEKLASLGYVGLQKRSAAGAAPVSGTNPKERIALANRILQAWQLLEDGRPEKALPVFQEASTQDANIFLAQYGLGVARLQLRQFEPAVAPLRRAIELQPGFSAAYFDMGMALSETGDWKAAAAHLEMAVLRRPGSASFHAALAAVYEKLGRSKEAAQEKARAAELGRPKGPNR